MAWRDAKPGLNYESLISNALGLSQQKFNIILKKEKLPNI